MNKSILSRFLSGIRERIESRSAYRARLKKMNEAVAERLRGRYAFISSRVLTLPERGVDVQIDHDIVNMKIRDVTEIKVPGKERDRFNQPLGRWTYIRVGRTKGETYAHPSKAAHPLLKRAARRALLRSGWRSAEAA